VRIEVVTEIKVVHVVSDTGYTSKMTLPEIEEWAKRRIDAVTVFMREGSLEPKPVRADKKVIKVIFTPDEKGGGNAS